MARSKSGKRDTNAVASDPLLGLTAPLRPSPVIPSYQLAYELQSLTEVEDRRTWHPAEDLRPLLAPTGRRAQQVLRDPMSRLRRFGAQTKAIPVFSHPNPLRTAIVCARRKARKEVFHALGLKRRGSGGGRKKRSNVKC